MTVDIVLATYRALPELDSGDALLIPALAERGLHARPATWNDPQMDWGRPLMTVIRSTWDYHLHRAAFLAWAERVGELHQLWNPPHILRWNTHKLYLRDLAEKQIAIVPTIWVEQGSQVDLAAVMAEHDWHRVVIKPAVSASAFATILISEDSVVNGQSHLNKFLTTRDMLLQPYISTVATTRERSLVYIDGEFTHAVERSSALDQRPTKNDQLVIPDTHELVFAGRVLDALPVLPLYARVDLIRDDASALCLMELELVEPTLWLHLAPHAVELFAEAIARRVP